MFLLLKKNQRYSLLLLWKQQHDLKSKSSKEKQVLSENWVLLFTAFTVFMEVKGNRLNCNVTSGLTTNEGFSGY